MAEDDTSSGHSEARRMLDICASVGARAVDLTLTNSDGEKESFRRDLSLAGLARALPAMLADATAKKRNVIIRPHGTGTVFLQLDDLDAGKLARVAPLCFVALETSPGNFQAWLAIPGREDKDFARRMRKGTGADPGASGATRIAGSLNFKPKYAPDYPRVAIRTAQPGRTVTAAELEQLGLVAPKEHFTQLPPARFEAEHMRTWPDYQYNLERAKPNKTGDGLDLSGVDFVWCMTAATWGFGVSDTAEMLLRVSEHARLPANGKEYAERTAKNAAGYVERRRQQKQMRHSR
jgi:RepB DNA-primase N-terminal domain